MGDIQPAAPQPGMTEKKGSQWLITQLSDRPQLTHQADLRNQRMGQHPGRIMALEDYLARPHALAGQSGTQQSDQVGRSALPPGFRYYLNRKMPITEGNQRFSQGTLVQQPVTPDRRRLREKLLAVFPDQVAVTDCGYEHR